MAAAGSSTCVTARPSVFRHEVEAVVEGEFDAFGEAFSVDGPDQGQMIGEQNALRILGRCDLRRGRSSTFTDVAAHSDHLGEVACARGGSKGQSEAGSSFGVGVRHRRAAGQRTGGFGDRYCVDSSRHRLNRGWGARDEAA